MRPGAPGMPSRTPENPSGATSEAGARHVIAARPRPSFQGAGKELREKRLPVCHAFVPPTQWRMSPSTSRAQLFHNPCRNNSRAPSLEKKQTRSCAPAPPDPGARPRAAADQRAAAASPRLLPAPPASESDFSEEEPSDEELYTTHTCSRGEHEQ